MARKPKAASPAEAAEAEDDTRAEQSELFISTARELGVDETGEVFERVLAKLLAIPPGPAPAPPLHRRRPAPA